MEHTAFLNAACRWHHPAKINGVRRGQEELAGALSPSVPYTDRGEVFLRSQARLSSAQGRSGLPHVPRLPVHAAFQVRVIVLVVIPRYDGKFFDIAKKCCGVGAGDASK